MHQEAHHMKLSAESFLFCAFLGMHIYEKESETLHVVFSPNYGSNKLNQLEQNVCNSFEGKQRLLKVRSHAMLYKCVWKIDPITFLKKIEAGTV